MPFDLNGLPWVRVGGCCCSLRGVPCRRNSPFPSAHICLDASVRRKDWRAMGGRHDVAGGAGAHGEHGSKWDPLGSSLWAGHCSPRGSAALRARAVRGRHRHGTD
eukprot:scaffold106_cov380-Prasinococcus_capsulatus_cf.AAC.27